MPNENLRTKPRPYYSLYSLVFLAAALLVAIISFSRLAPILLAFILTLLLTLAINPIIIKIRRWSGGRTMATGLVVLIFLCVAGLTGLAFYTPMKRSTTRFIERLPEYWERVQRPIMKMEQKAVISEERLKREVKTEVAREDGTNKTQIVEPPEPVEPKEPVQTPPTGFLRSGLGAIFTGVTGSFKGLASDAASLIITIITVFVGVVFTLLNPRPIIGMIYGMIPERKHPIALTISRRIVDFVPRWALATLMGMAIIGSLIFIAMVPLFGIQDALVLGLIAMVFEAVPYIGPILASVPALLLAVGDGSWKPLWVLLAYASVQALENNVIMPVVVGGRLKLHPVAVIFSMVLCVTTFGFLGVLIAMPMVAILLILHEEIYRPRFLPNVSDKDLLELAQTTLEKEKHLSGPQKIPREDAKK